MSTPFVDMYKHNLWANLQLLDACSGLTEEKLDATAPGTYGTVRNTLLHLVAAERRYVSMLNGQEADKTVHETLGFPGVPALRDSAEYSGKALIDIAGRESSGRTLTGTWRGEPFNMDIAIPLIQAINHATEHRMHVVSILSQNGVEMPDLDGWSFEEELKKS